MTHRFFLPPEAFRGHGLPSSVALVMASPFIGIGSSSRPRPRVRSWAVNVRCICSPSTRAA